MQTAVEDHVIYQVANAPLRTYPFPHFYVDSIFPDSFYSELRRNWPSGSELVSLGSTGRVPEGTYAERFIMPLRDGELAALPTHKRAFWTEVTAWMLGSDRFFLTVLTKFAAQLRARFGEAFDETPFVHEVLVVRDHSNYSLGPHTDARRKAVSLLFYCPDDESYAHLGTSLYAPVDPAFRCAGGPHHAFELFRKITTMPFKPNALFAFVKTDNSFHGVDPIRDADVLRDLILYDIQAKGAFRSEGELAATQQAAAPAPRTGSPAQGGLGARMLKSILRRGR